jgi:putative SOS response-associated peptidase YedK
VRHSRRDRQDSDDAKCPHKTLVDRSRSKRKAPHHIRLRDGAAFGFAGIYTPPSEELPGTYAIMTTTPSELLPPIHDRMPVILEPEFEALWLDPGVTDPDAVLPLPRPFAAERMEAYRVGVDIGTPANDRPTWWRRSGEPTGLTGLL